MDSLIILKSSFADWIEQLLATCRVLAPAAEPEGTLRFRPVTAPDQVVLGGAKAVRSPKEHLIPQTEGLLTFEGRAANLQLRSIHPEPSQRVILGARPCDARALATLDDVFLKREPTDTRYEVRRRQALLVGLACNRPGWGCFCTSVGGSPAGTEGLDLLLTDLEDRYHAAALTDGGRALAELAQTTPAQDSEVAAAQTLHREAAAKMKPVLDLANLSSQLDWDSEGWQRHARRCLGCGVCSFLCPTCHCFDIQDETTAEGGFRFRCWDTCQFDDFTLQGHGHNPRPSRKERVRQRLLHKFKYLVTEFDRVGCTGCGRCVEACPVNLDIRPLLAHAPGEGQEVETPTR